MYLLQLPKQQQITHLFLIWNSRVKKELLLIFHSKPIAWWANEYIEIFCTHNINSCKIPQSAKADRARKGSPKIYYQIEKKNRNYKSFSSGPYEWLIHHHLRAGGVFHLLHFLFYLLLARTTKLIDFGYPFAQQQKCKQTINNVC